MRNLLIGSAALLLVLTGCGGDDDDGQAAEQVEQTEPSPTSEEPSVGEEVEDLEALDPDDLPACEDQWAEGEVVTQAELDAGCIDGDGEWLISGSAVEECSDGRVLRWNDLAWWYEGEGVHPHAPDAEELVAPAEEREACQA